MPHEDMKLPPLTASTGSARLSVFLLAVAGFVIVSTEFLIVGLIPKLSQDLGISIPVAGQLVTLFAVTVMIFGPFLTMLMSHLERKRLFISILALFAISNAVAALAPNIWILGLARFVPALALPVFWGTASETAGLIAGPEKAGKAISQVYLGISAAMVLGIPIGTLISSEYGWRASFWALSLLSLAMAIALFFFMPQIAAMEKKKIGDQLTILKDRYFLGNVILSVLVFTAMFTAYTYLADTLERLANIPSSQVGWWLMGFGVVGLGGNWLGGYFVDRSPLKTTLFATLALIIGMISIAPLAQSGAWLILPLALWGLANTALYPICQVRVMKSASHAQALAGTLNVSMANAGIGIGAVLGGLTIERLGLSQLGLVASIIAVLAIITIPIIARFKKASTLSSIGF